MYSAHHDAFQDTALLQYQADREREIKGISLQPTVIAPRTVPSLVLADAQVRSQDFTPRKESFYPLFMGGQREKVFEIDMMTMMFMLIIMLIVCISLIMGALIGYSIGKASVLERLIK